MKSFIFFTLLFISLIVQAQSLNIPQPGSLQDRLDDIEDELRRMQMDRMREKLLDDLYKQPIQPRRNETFRPPYQNKQSNEERIKYANFYNLTMKQYLEKDFVANINCEKFDGSTSQQLIVWQNCYMSSMIGVPMEVISSRRQKAKNMCSDFINEYHSEKKQLDCVKPYLVLGK